MIAEGHEVGKSRFVIFGEENWESHVRPSGTLKQLKRNCGINIRSNRLLMIRCEEGIMWLI